jgi:hypothetical protein
MTRAHARAEGYETETARHDTDRLATLAADLVQRRVSRGRPPAPNYQ